MTMFAAADLLLSARGAGFSDVRQVYAPIFELLLSLFPTQERRLMLLRQLVGPLLTEPIPDSLTA